MLIYRFYTSLILSSLHRIKVNVFYFVDVFILSLNSNLYINLNVVAV